VATLAANLGLGNLTTGPTGLRGTALSLLQDVEVTSLPDDSISCMNFIPPTMPGNFHIQGSWTNDVSDYGLGSVAQQMHTGHVLDICWSDESLDRNKVLLASCDKTAKMWDLNRNQDDDKMILMKTHVYPLHCCVEIFKAKRALHGLCTGGRMAIHYINPPNLSNGTNTATLRPCYWRVNAISFHPVHGTISTVGPDRCFIFWYKDARTKLKTSEQLDILITTCCFHNNGNIFAYTSSYDWSKEHEYYNSQKNTKYIFLPNAAEEQDMRTGGQKWCWLWG
uniref:Rae1 protein homolog n=1 Tax=Oncorhynchus kisutch TaxID=8019 RepID=A0A8C7M6A7_ONCKI